MNAVATAFANAYLRPAGPPSQAFIDAIPLAVRYYGCTDMTKVIASTPSTPKTVSTLSIHHAGRQACMRIIMHSFMYLRDSAGCPGPIVNGMHIPALVCWEGRGGFALLVHHQAGLLVWIAAVAQDLGTT